PERLVLFATVGTSFRGEAPDHRAAQPRAGASLELGDRQADVHQRNQSNPDQALRIVGAKLSQPVVVNLKAVMLQFAIAQCEQWHPQAGIEHFGAYAIDILILEPFGRIPSAGTGSFVAGAEMLFKRLAAAAGCR